MAELKIERSWLGFCCLFFIGSQEYLGSLIIRSDLGYETECVIFKTTNGQFTFEDALGECMMRGVEYSQDALRECVTDFISSRIH